MVWFRPPEIGGTSNVGAIGGSGAGALNVNGTLIEAPHVVPGGPTVTKIVNLNIGGKLDLADNDMVIDYASGNSPIATIRGYLQQGRGPGDLAAGWRD